MKVQNVNKVGNNTTTEYSLTLSELIAYAKENASVWIGNECSNESYTESYTKQLVLELIKKLVDNSSFESSYCNDRVTLNKLKSEFLYNQFIENFSSIFSLYIQEFPKLKGGKFDMNDLNKKVYLDTKRNIDYKYFDLKYDVFIRKYATESLFKDYANYKLSYCNERFTK